MRFQSLEPTESSKEALDQQGPYQSLLQLQARPEAQPAYLEGYGAYLAVPE